MKAVILTTIIILLQHYPYSQMRKNLENQKKEKVFYKIIFLKLNKTALNTGI